MKNIDQIAGEIGVTKQAIYKKFSSLGLSVNDLICEKQGKTKVYGEQAESAIKRLFGVEPYDNSDYLQKIGELERALTSETEARQAAENRAIRAENQVDLLLIQIDKLTDSVRAESAANAVQITKLLGLHAQKEKTVIQRLKAWVVRGKQSDSVGE